MEELGIGVYVCHCGLNISGTVDVEEVAKYAEALPHVVASRHRPYTCSDPGQDLIVVLPVPQGPFPCTTSPMSKF